jgi:hypothetical protein
MTAVAHAALLLGYLIAAVVLAGSLMGHTPRVAYAAAVAFRNWFPLPAKRCPDCGRKNPGPNHECPYAPAPALRVPTWARKDTD